MPITEIYDQAVPTGATDPKQIDEQMTLKWRALGERLRAGGHVWETGAPIDAQAGHHAIGVDPDGDAKQFVIYESDETTAALTLDEDEAGTVPNVQVAILGDGLTGANKWTLRCDTLQGGRDSTVNIPLLGNTGRQVGLIYENRGGPGAAGAGTITLLEARLIAWTGPTGSALDVDIHKLTSGYTDPAAAGVSIFAANPHPTIAAAAKVGTPVTVFDDAVLAVGDAWVFEIDALNSAADIVLELKVRRTNA